MASVCLHIVKLLFCILRSKCKQRNFRVKMSEFEPTKQHIREALLFCFNLKKSAAETHRMLVNTYGDCAPSKTTCSDWFTRFQSGDFDTKDKERPGQKRKFKDDELKTLIEEDPCRTLIELANLFNVNTSTVGKRLKLLDIIHVDGRWVPK